MFRTFMYLDEAVLRSYSTQLGILKSRKIGVSKGNVQADLGLVAGAVELESDSQSFDETVALYDQFEKKLIDLSGDEYFDFLTDDYDQSTLPSMSLFRFRGFVDVPQSFDMINSFSKLAPKMFETGVLGSDMDEISKVIMRGALCRADVQIPVVMEGLGIKVASKIKSNCIIGGDAVDLEFLSEEEATFLCKVECYRDSEEVAIYDPLRDFMKLGRAMRRHVERVDGLDVITESGPLIRAETVAIYH